MRFYRAWLILGLLLAGLTAPVPAQEKIIPCPPEFIQDKQLPGEDPYDISKPVFSPDNAHVAAFMFTSKKITIWDVKTAAVVKEITDDVHGMHDGIDGMEWTNDGKQLILLRNFQPLTWLDWNAGKVTRTIDMQADPKKIMSYVFSPDQSLLAVGTYSGVQVWDLKAGKKTRELAKGQAISGLDLHIWQDNKGKWHRLLAYARAVLPPDLKWHNLAGVMDLDSGKEIPLLNDIPADKKVEDTQTWFWVTFEGTHGHILVTYSVFPPKVKAGVFLIDTWTGKYISNQSLGQLVVKDHTPFYLWKPFYGYSIDTEDMSQPGSPYKAAIQFLVPTDKGMVILDTIDETTLPAFGLRYSHDYTLASVVLKKDAQDTAKLWLYRVVPKKKK